MYFLYHYIGGLGSNRCGSSAGVSTTVIKPVLRRAGVSSVSELRDGDLKQCDDIAEYFIKIAICEAVAEGAGTGAAGAAGMVVDLPALITMAITAIHQVGACYGYECNSYEEEQFVMQVLASVNALTVAEKRQSVYALHSIGKYVSRTTFKQMAKEAAKTGSSKSASKALDRLMAKAVIGVREVAGKIGVKLTKNVIKKVIPGVGAVIGAGSNAKYIHDVAYGAKLMYQRRWLVDNDKYICVEAV